MKLRQSLFQTASFCSQVGVLGRERKEQKLSSLLLLKRNFISLNQLPDIKQEKKQLKTFEILSKRKKFEKRKIRIRC